MKKYLLLAGLLLAIFSMETRAEILWAGSESIGFLPGKITRGVTWSPIFSLTEKGRDFLPILSAMGEWGRKHCGDGPTSVMIDADTGAVIQPVVVDRTTGRPLAEIEARVVQPGG